MRGMKGMLLDLLIFSLFNLLNAATVPQDSPEKYYFSRPNVPSNIVGQVMGSPAAYSVPRSEDVAWLYEAACERRALKSGYWNMASNTVYVPQFGSWPLSESNRFVRWTAALVVHDGVAATNIVVGWTTNAVRGTGVDSPNLSLPWYLVGANLNDALASVPGDDDGYLATDDGALAGAAQAFDVTGGWLEFTNVWTEAVWTNAYTNAESVITMPGTNGTLSAWTNRWQAAATVTFGRAATNVTGISDVAMCFAGGVAAAYTNRLQLPPRSSSVLIDPGSIPIAAWTVTNQYSWMDGMRRIGKGANALTPVSATNYTWNAGGIHGGSSSSGTKYEWSAFSALYAYKDGEGVHTTPDDSGSEQAPYPDVQSLLFALPVATNVTRAGGAERLSRVRLWAVLEIEASETSWAFGVGDFVDYYQTNEYYVASVPLGEAQIAEPTNGVEAVRASVDFDAVRRAACAAAGVTLHGRGWTPGPRFPLPTPEEDDSTSTETRVWIDAYMRFVAIVDYEPWTKMPIGGAE